ncbi:tip elongation aberrant protein 1 isoform X1 [Pyrus x bretschneideri]|uniref:tip elongation aberrant protein 1 isoform X1 n=1 Tax=Pyrus x bretschneideri TaxID=225117 RepID=UPI00202ED42C|nr:tip elongation aberrant protein 1 isoform X1 [Pyrus x bretschneideri]
MKWERVQLQPKQAHLQQQEQEGGGVAVGEVSGPGKRWGHTCNAIKEGRMLYVFGGYGRDNCQTNEVHVFDTATHSWSQPVIKGTPPTPRDSHSCTTVGNNLFVFGGTDGMNPLRDLHILDTSLHTWISPSLRGEAPEAREGHSAALVGKRLFIFGGCGKSASSDNEVYFNDLYILNTETFVWKRATTSGNPPSRRDSHTCSSWKNKLIVIGGEDGHDYYLSDVHILDTDTLIWRELKTTGQFMPPRGGHCTVAFGKNLFVFGGFTDAQNLYNDLYMLDVDTGVWTKVLTAGDGPSARFSVAGDCLDPVKGGVLVFIGGCSKGLEALDDMFYLNTGLARENESKLEKLSLRKKLKLKCQEQNLTSVHDRALVPVGTSADMSQPMPVSFYAQQCRQNIPSNQSQLSLEKKTFVAKVTDKLSDGYAIETVVDGKLLRGIVFPNRPGFNIDIPNSSRKRTASEAGGLMSNGDYSSKSKTSRGIRQETTDLTDNVHGKAPISHEQTEAAAGSISNNQAYSAASHLHKVTGNPEQSEVPLNLGKNQANNAPNSNSEVVGDNGTHKPTDAPNFNAAVTRESLSANSAAASSLSQGDRKLTSEGQNDAASI